MALCWMVFILDGANFLFLVLFIDGFIFSQ